MSGHLGDIFSCIIIYSYSILYYNYNAVRLWEVVGGVAAINIIWPPKLQKKLIFRITDKKAV